MRQVLRIRVKNGYLLDLLIRCLEEWTAGGSGIYQKGHGIPQGPEASALLAEVLLADFDAQTYPDVRYVRYVDDVKLLGKTFSAVDRALLKLDLRCKTLGLVPQAQKIERRRVSNIKTVLKTVPSGLDSLRGGRRFTRMTAASKRRLLRVLNQSLERRKGELSVKDTTRFRFALYRLPPLLRVLRRLRPILLSRPDLSGLLAAYVSRFANKGECQDILYNALSGDPVFDAAAGDYVLSLDRIVPRFRSARFKRLVSQLPSRSVEKSLLMRFPVNLFVLKRMRLSALVPKLQKETNPLVAGLLVHQLSFDPQHASITPSQLAGPIRRFAASSDPDLARYSTYLMLAALKVFPGKPATAGRLLIRHLGIKLPLGKESLLLRFFKDLFKLDVNVNWERNWVRSPTARPSAVAL